MILQHQAPSTWLQVEHRSRRGLSSHLQQRLAAVKRACSLHLIVLWRLARCQTRALLVNPCHVQPQPPRMEQ